MSENILNIESEKVFSLKDKIDIKKDMVNKEVVSKCKDTDIMLVSVPKGKILEPHKAPGDALVTIIEGEAKLNISNSEYNLSECKSIVIPANVVHSLSAISDIKVLVIVMK